MLLLRVAGFHENDGCCCCLESEGRWPSDLPHWEHLFWDDEDDDDDATYEPAPHDWVMPDGVPVTPAMVDLLSRRRIRNALDNPAPPGTWP